MRKMMLLAVMAATALSMVPSHAAFEVSGFIPGPGPASKSLGGINELVNPCGAPDPDLGVLPVIDGQWFEVPEGHDLADATLVTSGGAVDVDIWWYDEACGGMFSTDPASHHRDFATLGTADGTGKVPEGAAYGIVDLAVGAAVNFTFTVS